MVSIVAVLGVYFPARQLATLEGNLEQRAVTYGRLVSKQMRSVVAFDDNETAREVFEALAQDPAVASLVLFTQHGDILQSYGAVRQAALAARHGVQRQHVFVLDNAVLVVAPVQSLEGPRGTLAIELSTAALQQSRTQVRATALLVGSSVLLGGVLAAFLIARSFARRLRALAEVAARVTDGDLDAQKATDDSRDEIGVLTTGFNAMLDRLRSLIDHMQSSARELKSRNEDMRLVLQTVSQGFVTIDHHARMSRDRSAILEAWLGPAVEGATLWQYIAQTDINKQTRLEHAWAEVTAGVIPLEITLGLMPTRINANGRRLALEYHPILQDGDRFEKMLVVITDISSPLPSETAQADERERPATPESIIAFPKTEGAP
jgi:nitrogen fixation/metabolism regulation signal transduction histidine kinase